MGLLADMPWQWWIVPALLAGVWLLLWFGSVSGRARMWYAGLAPLFCVAIFVVGVVITFTVTDSPQGSCVDSGPCGTGGAAHWAYGLASLSDVGVAIAVNAVLAGVISLPLLVITAAVDLPRMAAVREAEAARAASRAADGGGQPRR